MTWDSYWRHQEQETAPPFTMDDLKKANPYAHWWITKDRDPTGRGATTEASTNIPDFVSFLKSNSDQLQAMRQKAATQNAQKEVKTKTAFEFLSVDLDKASEDVLNQALGGIGILLGKGEEPGAIVAQPKETVNQAFDPDNWMPTDLISHVCGTADPDEARKDLPKDTVISIVIDDAIALGHSRFRLPDQNGVLDTRILAAWLQGAVHIDGQPEPFGREVFRTELREMMKDHTVNRWLDETAFNRALAPSTEGRTTKGVRRLARTAAHGTHVLDLAAGAEPIRENEEALRKHRIIAINLPSPDSIGMSGSFLEYYAMHALFRAVALVDRLWLDLYGDEHPDRSFPMVVNMSYGQQAGTKTGSSGFELFWQEVQKNRRVHFDISLDGNISRQSKDPSPLRLVMPVGNDNLNRCNARWALKYHENAEAHAIAEEKATKAGDAPPPRTPSELKMTWRVLPQDQSANFVEVWADLTVEEAVKSLADGVPLPLEMSVTRRGNRPDWFAGLHEGIHNNDEEQMRVYSDLLHLPSDDPLAKVKWRLRYVIAIRPTLDFDRLRPVARAGVFDLAFRWVDGAAHDDADKGRNVYIGVQVDQDPSFATSTSLRSYLETPQYRTHAPSGRPLDSYAYLPSEANLAGAGINLEPANAFKAVQRKGTHNSQAVDTSILTIAGHRQTDGRPADFSGTYFPGGQTPGGKPLRDRPVASFPVDHGAVQLGIRAAGPISGATVSLRGTSFAAPQAARWVAERFREALDNSEDLADVGSVSELERQATAEDAQAMANNAFAAPAAPAKVGLGRMQLRRCGR